MYCAPCHSRRQCPLPHTYFIPHRDALWGDTYLVKSIQCSLQSIGVAALQALHKGHEKLRPCWQAPHSHYHRHICPHHMPQRLARAPDCMQERNLRRSFIL